MRELDPSFHPSIKPFAVLMSAPYRRHRDPGRAITTLMGNSQLFPFGMTSTGIWLSFA